MTTPTNRPIDYQYYLPWLRLFRAGRMAIDPKKLLVASLSVTLLIAGGQLIDFLIAGPMGTVEETPVAPSVAAYPWTLQSVSATAQWLVQGGVRLSDAILGDISSIALPVFAIIWPGKELLSFSFSQQTLSSGLHLIWSILVWTLGGTILTRLSAVEFAAGERVSLMTASRFALSKWIATISAMILPISGLVAIALGCAVLGLIGLIPAVGPWIVAILYFLVILAGIAALLILYGLVAGWPLMVAAISTEGGDAFDGFSRAYSYLLGRPWTFLWSLCVSALFGVLLLAIVNLAANAVLYMGNQFVSIGGGETPLAADRIMAFWLGVFAFFVNGFAVSYFWSAVTIIYFLLRRADDATFFDEVYREPSEQEDRLAPLAGIAATDQAVTEVDHRTEGSESPSDASPNPES